MRNDREGQLFYINTKWLRLFLTIQKQEWKGVFFLSWLLQRYLQKCKFTPGKPLPFKTLSTQQKFLFKKKFFSKYF